MSRNSFYLAKAVFRIRPLTPEERIATAVNDVANEFVKLGLVSTKSGEQFSRFCAALEEENRRDD